MDELMSGLGALAVTTVTVALMLAVLKIAYWVLFVWVWWEMDHSKLAQPCTVYTLKQYSCMFCNKKVHRGDSGCSCSTLRKEFNLASICTSCAELYDMLITSVKFKPILKFLIDKAYWEGAGPAVDF